MGRANKRNTSRNERKLKIGSTLEASEILKYIYIYAHITLSALETSLLGAGAGSGSGSGLVIGAGVK